MDKQRRVPGWLNVLLWITQILLSLALIWAAWMKLFSSKEELTTMWPWTAEHPDLVRLTGWLDLLAGLGLVLPGLLRVAQQLTVYTAWGVIALMVAASVFHVARGETSSIGINVFFALLAAMIVWGRNGKRGAV